MKCKDAIEHFKRTDEIFKLLDQKMNVVEEIVNTMEVFHVIMIEMQRRGTTLSDFYGFWLIIKMNLEECQKKPHHTNLVDYLLECMENRKSQLIDQPIMLAAIFLDPRYRHKIINDPDKTRAAKLQICKIWEKIQFNKNNSTVSIPAEEQVEIQPSTQHKRTQTMTSLYSKLDQDFTADGIQRPVITNEPKQGTEPNYTKEKHEILLALDKFNPPRLKPDCSVLEFWRDETKGESSFHEIGQVAFVTYGIPPSEVDTERDMSKLAIIFSERRSQLDEHLLERILLIHLNKDLFLKVKEEQLAAVKIT